MNASDVLYQQQLTTALRRIQADADCGDIFAQLQLELMSLEQGRRRAARDLLPE